MSNSGLSVQLILTRVVPALIVAAIIAIATKLLTHLTLPATLLLSVGLVAIGLSIYLLAKGEKTRRVRFAWAFVGILVGVILLGIGIRVEYRSAFEFPPAKEGESLIIISTFDRIGKQWEEHVESIIRDALVDTATSVGFGPNELRVEITKSVLHEDDAKAFGQKYGAVIVIYGESGDFGVKPALKICTAGLEPYSPHAKRIVLTESDDIAVCILQELPTRSVYLTLFALGVVSYHSETPDYSRAETLFDKALETVAGQTDRTVDASVAFFFLGNISYYRDSLGQALEQWKKAVEINPDYAEAHINLGVAYRHKGLLDEAIREYKEALRIAPDYAMPHYNLGNAYYDKGLLDEAIREYQEALRIEPDFAYAHYNLASTYEETDTSAALEHWQRYLEVARNDPQQQKYIPVAKQRLRELQGK